MPDPKDNLINFGVEPEYNYGEAIKDSLQKNLAIYEAINQPVLLRVPKTAKRILDIGCGTGSLGREIKQEINCEVVGVTYSKLEAESADKCLDRVIIGDINSFNPQKLGKFDCIICSHILEHLYQPQALLTHLHDNLSVDGIILVALPNVLHWKQRWEFIRGRFRYTDGGLMDKTHFRFFDWKTAHELLEQGGYQVVEAEADGNFPLPLLRKVCPPKFVAYIDKMALNKFPGLFGFQFIFSCKSKLGR
jgi:SAM-dependent methyltransferase